MAALLLWICVPAAMLLAVGLLYESYAEQCDARRYPAPGRLIAAPGGQRLHLRESGAGEVTVVLEAGLAATSLNWSGMQRRLAGSVRVVCYDRAGLGWSDAAMAPRTPAAMAADLRNALRAAGIEPPYVLVGHSFGALTVQSYALAWPAELVGVVLVDPLLAQAWTPMTDSQQRKWRLGLRLARRAGWLARFGVIRLAVMAFRGGSGGVSRRLGHAIAGAATQPYLGALDRVAGLIGKMPRDVWPVAAAHWCSPKTFQGIAAHLEAFPQSVEEMAMAGPIQGLPVTVVCAEGNSELSRENLRAIAHDARRIVARGSGHWVHLDCPELVVDAILDVVNHCTPLQAAGVR